MVTIQQAKEILIKNKKILLHELKESKEAIFLLSKSTHTKLTDEEKEKLRIQLIDICKAIPAFTVFMLPGGAILLPLLVKIIPDILPSTFRNGLPEEDGKKN